MEVSSFSSAALRKRMESSAVKDLVFEAVLSAQRSILCLLFLTGSQLNGFNGLPESIFTHKSFPLDELHKVAKPGPENKDASDTEDDDEDDDDDDDDDQDDDDAGDEDFSGEEEAGDDDEDGDPEEVPAANGNDDNDDDDEDGEDGEDGEDEDEEDEEEDEEEDQPPTKKTRK